MGNVEYHAPDPRMEVRDCSCVVGIVNLQTENEQICHDCNGTGRVVGQWIEGCPGPGLRTWERAACQDVIRVEEVGGPGPSYQRWWAGFRDVGFYASTAAEALRAARAAYWGVEIITNESIGETTATYRLLDGRVCGSDYGTPDAALIAAIDADPMPQLQRCELCSNGPHSVYHIGVPCPHPVPLKVLTVPVPMVCPHCGGAL